MRRTSQQSSVGVGRSLLSTTLNIVALQFFTLVERVEKNLGTKSKCISRKLGLMPCLKTILNCFALKHSAFKTKDLKDSIFLQIILLSHSKAEGIHFSFWYTTLQRHEGNIGDGGNSFISILFYSEKQ